MEENESKIEFVEEGVISKEENKTKRKILYVIVPILLVSIFLVSFSLTSAIKCVTDAKQQTKEYFRVGNIIDKDGSLTGVKLTQDQVYNYNLNKCVKQAPFANKKLVSFLIGFLFETLLLFLFIWLVDKNNKVSSLLKAMLVAFYLSLIFFLGISVFIIGGIVGWGFVSRILEYGPVKTTVVTLGAMAIYYGLIMLLMNFVK